MKKQQLLLIPALILGCEMTAVAAPLSMKPLMAMAAEAAEEAGDLTISMDNGAFTGSTQTVSMLRIGVRHKTRR